MGLSREYWGCVMTNLKRDFKGIWIPKELWFSEELSLQEKCFLAEINSLDNGGGCYATNTHFSKVSNLSKNRCTEIIQSLKDKNVISIDYEYDGEEIKKRILKIKKSFGLKTCVEKNVKNGVLEKSSTYSEKGNLVLEKSSTYSEKGEDRITIENNNIDNNTYANNIHNREISNSNFLAPKLEEVLEYFTSYCEEKKININPQLEAEIFVDFYESKNWFVGKSKMKDWKAAVRNWLRYKQNKRTSYSAEQQNNKVTNPIEPTEPPIPDDPIYAYKRHFYTLPELLGHAEAMKRNGYTREAAYESMKDWYCKKEDIITALDLEGLI